MKPIVLYTVAKDDPSPGNSVSVTAPDGSVLWRTLADREGVEKAVRLRKGCLGSWKEAEQSGALKPFYQTRVARLVCTELPTCGGEKEVLREVWTRRVEEADVVLECSLPPVGWFGIVPDSPIV